MADPLATNIKFAVGRNTDGRLEVFARGADNALWNVWQTSPNGAWAHWSSLGGVLTSNPAVWAARQWLPGRVRARHRLCAVHNHRTFAGGSRSAWQSLGGVLTSNPAVGRALTDTVIAVS